jgi:Tol biopolymer transport system component
LRREIFAGPAGSAGRHLSADGQTLYYSARGSSGLELRVVDLETPAEELIGTLAEPTRWGSVTTSHDGRWLAYVSARPSSETEDSAGFSDIVLLDRVTQAHTLVTLNSSHTPANGSSDLPSLSADGRFLGFRSRAGNLVPGDENGASDVFLYDRTSATITLLSRSLQGRSGSAPSTLPLVSANGDFVIFQSFAEDLVAGDYNAGPDVFLFSNQPTGTLAIQTVTRSSDGYLTINWRAEAGWRYRVEFRDDLAAGSWTVAQASVPVQNGAAVFAEQPPARGPQRFFRIVAEQE